MAAGEGLQVRGGEARRRRAAAQDAGRGEEAQGSGRVAAVCGAALCLASGRRRRGQVLEIGRAHV